MMQNILKISWFIILLWFVLLWVTQAFDWTQCEERTFVLTAYYSPVADQAFYYKDNYQKEIRLNGTWTHGAAGEPVFNGMLAAPQSYSFGGKIYFPDLGVWKISDRGGAIVEAWERRFASDRIDVWMWYGEAGLIRSLDFGVQTKTWYYCSASKLTELWVTPKVWFDFNNIPIFKNFFDLALWKQNLWPERRDVWVYTLQKYLVKLGYLNQNKQTGTFDTITKKALCRYQTKKQISSPRYVDCGVFWPRTRAVMQKDVKNKWLFPANLWAHGSVTSIVETAKSWDIAEDLIADIKLKQENTSEYFSEPFKKSSYDKKVIKLQYLLDYLWFYKGDKDGIFDQDVVDAVYAFQLDKWILKWEASESNLVWYVWPATRSALNNALKAKHKFEKLAKLEELLVEPKNSKQKKLAFEFYRPYKKWELPNEEIRILQRFLTDIGLYQWKINGKYDSVTVDAIYAFQLRYGLLTKDSHYTLHGYLWPKTRDKLNEMRKFGKPI